jgi:hypothetical protein
MIGGLVKKASEDRINALGDDTELVSLEDKKADDNDSLKISTQKITESKKLIIKDEDQVLFCISVDGSQHSEMAFDVTTQEFLNKASKLLVIHVYNEKMNHLYNYNNKKDTVIQNYINKLMIFSTISNFIVEDRNQKAVHALEQVNKQCVKYKANYLISGYYGIKGQKAENKELSKGVDYLLSYSRVPTIVFKDITLRADTKTKGYNWLVIFDKQFNNTIRCFKAFLPLINPEKDFVFGLTLVPNPNMNDDIKEEFLKEVEGNGISNYKYECNSYIRAPSVIITEKINYGEVLYDFVVFYNNREKYRNEGANTSDITNIVTKSNCSICIYNF